MRFAATRAVLLAAGLALTPLLATAQDAQPAPEDIVIAEVDGVEITYAEVIDAIARLPMQSQQMPAQVLVPAITDQLIAARLIEARGYADNLADDPEVIARLDVLRGLVIQDVWLERQITDRVTEEALEAYYEAWLADNPVQPEIRARHILVETEELALDLIAQLNDGAAFADLAREYSTDPGSGPRGGDLGYFPRGVMVPDFEEAAFALEPGSHSAEPVESRFGWHIILVEDAREPEPPSFAEMRDELANEFVQQEIRTIVEALRAEADITVYGPEGRPAD